MKNKRQVALKQLPNKKEIDKLLQDISYHAIESGLVVLLFKPQKEIKKNFYAEIPVDIKLSGTYHDQAIFFDKIECKYTICLYTRAFVLLCTYCVDIYRVP